MKKKAKTQKPLKKPAMRYLVVEDPGDIGISLFKKVKADFIAFHDDETPFNNTYLYFISKETAEIVSNLLSSKKPYACTVYYCLKLKGTLDQVIEKLGEKADLKKIK